MNKLFIKWPRTHPRFAIRRVTYRLLLLYFFATPLETTINRVLTSSIKYLIVVIFASFMLHTLSRKKRLVLHRFAIAEMIWLLITLCSIIWSSYPASMGLIVTYASMISLFIVLGAQSSLSKKEYENCLTAYMLGGLTLAAMLIAWGESGRIYSTSGRLTVNVMGIEGGDENNLSALLAPGVVIAFYGMASSQKIKDKGAYCLILMVLLYAQMLTGSRGGMLSSLVGVFCVPLFSNDRERKLISLAFVFLILYILAERYLQAVLRSRLLDIYTYESGSGRTDIWKVGLREWLSRLVLGLGLQGWYNKSLVNMGRLLGTHNTYLQVLLDTGILGFAFFIAPYLRAIGNAIRRQAGREMAILAAAMVSAFFLDSLQVRYLWNGLLLAMIAMNIARHEKSRESAYGTAKTRRVLK